MGYPRPLSLTALTIFKRESNRNLLLSQADIVQPDLLLLLIPTIAAVSLTPGMCMTLAFTLGLTQGYRRTLFMMLGELVGVAVVISTTVLLLAWLLALDAIYFQLLSVVGGGYLLWIAWQLWCAEEHFAARKGGTVLGRGALVGLGFMTAVMNPKGWAFMIALLPSFIDPQGAIAPQLAVLLAVMLCTEFLSLSLYAGGGKWLGGLLTNDANLKLLNRFAALLMVAVAVLVFI